MFGHELDSLYLAFERGGSGAYGYPPAASDFRKHDRVDRDRATAAPLALSRKRARDLQKEPVALFLRVSGRGILEAVRDSSTSFALLTSLLRRKPPHSLNVSLRRSPRFLLVCRVAAPPRDRLRMTGSASTLS